MHDRESLLVQDLAARKQAIDTTRSVIVKAPAGSGKTSLLVQRFLALLGKVEKPENVLAITFTRKATAQMRERVMQSLMHTQLMQRRRSDNTDQTVDLDELSEFEKLNYELASRVLENDQKFNWGLLNAPHRLQILTIDALATRVAQAAPLLSGLGSQLRLLENPSDIYEQAAINTVQTAENFSQRHLTAVKRTLTRVDGNIGRCVRMIVELLANRDQWSSHLFKLIAQPDDHRIQSENAITHYLRHELNEFGAMVSDQAIELCNQLLLHIDRGIAAHNPPFLNLFASKSVSSDKRDIQAAISQWKIIAEIALTKDSKWRKRLATEYAEILGKVPSPDGVGLLWKASIDALQGDRATTIAEKLNQIRLLPDPGYTDDEWQALLDLTYTLQMASAQLRILFAEKRCCDFIAQVEAAQHALTHLTDGEDSQPSDLAFALDYQVQHLLIDEFQDTSISHYNLIHRLILGYDQAASKTLFVVGDPMQSIYRFRDAEVGLFMQLFDTPLNQNRQLPVALNAVTLHSNFRSHTQIVDWNNQLFGSILPSSDDVISGACKFEHSIASNSPLASTAQTDPHRPGVFLHAFCLVDSDVASQVDYVTDDHDCFDKDAKIGDDNEQNNFGALSEWEQEAEFIAQQVAKYQLDESIESIAILIRAKNHALPIIQALQQHSMPFFAVAMKRLTEIQVVQDLCSLILALSQPYDRVAWLSLLRAPWCGLTMEHIEFIVNLDSQHQLTDKRRRSPGQKSKRMTQPLWLAIQQAAKLSAFKANQPLQRFVAVIEQAMTFYGKHAVIRLARRAWVQLGGPACLELYPLEYQRSDAWQAIDMLMQIVERKFGHQLVIDEQALYTELNGNFLDIGDSGAKIEIMTIHKAKGLEFDVVFAPSLQSKPPAPSSPLVALAEIPIRTGREPNKIYADDSVNAVTARNASELLIAPIPSLQNNKIDAAKRLHALAKKLEQRRYLEEQKRLLYVLATRAKRILHLSAQLKKKKNGDFAAPISGSLLFHLWPALEHDFIAAAGANYPEDKLKLSDDAAEKGIMEKLPSDGKELIRLDKNWRLPENPHHVITPADQDSLQVKPIIAEEIEFEWTGMPLRAAGIVVHEMLCLIARKGIENWPASFTQSRNGFEEFQSLWRNRLRELGLTQSEDIALALKRIEHAVYNSITDDRGRWILSATHEDSHVELPLSGIVENKALQVYIDRTFVSEGIRWIIDYKTSWYEGEDVESFLQSEKLRYTSQLENYSQLMQYLDERPIKVALYFPLLKAWLPWAPNFNRNQIAELG